MSLFRRLARLMVAWIFVYSAIDVVRHPEGRAKMAGPFISKLRERLPMLPADDVMLVRANSATQVAAGVVLASGRLPRLSSFILAASLVPTTLAGHPFWTIDDPKHRGAQRTQFNKNLCMLGGLLLAATEPSVRHRRPGAPTDS
jgi:putative oxidoreductase